MLPKNVVVEQQRTSPRLDDRQRRGVIRLLLENRRLTLAALVGDALKQDLVLVVTERRTQTQKAYVGFLEELATLLLQEDRKAGVLGGT